MEALPAAEPTQRSIRMARLRNFAVIMAVVGCFVGMGYAFTQNETVTLPLGTAIEGVEPAFGATAVPGQTPVKVDLAFGYTGELRVDDVPLPADEVTYEQAQAILTFSPSAGKSVGRFTNGIHVAQLVYWPLTNPSDRKFFQWSFTVV